MSYFTKHIVQELTTQKVYFGIWSTNSLTQVGNLQNLQGKEGMNP